MNKLNLNQNAGIDYGKGQTNINHETDIRYGVIQHDVVGSVWYDESEMKYGKPLCPVCNNELDESSEYNDSDIENEYFCSVCQKGVDGNREDIYPESPICFFYIQDGYKCFQSYDDPDIFIEDSPYYTLCNFCSPCAPGAGYIMNQNESGIKAYCFGHDWFEDGKALYKIFNVKTGKEVLPE